METKITENLIGNEVKEDHVLEIVSYDDGIAECSCGKWHFTKTGAITRAKAEREHYFHQHGKFPAADALQPPAHTPGPPPFTLKNVRRITNNPNACLCRWTGQDFIFCALHGSAPDLLEVLRTIRDCTCETATRAIATDAIAKATAESEWRGYDRGKQS